MHPTLELVTMTMIERQWDADHTRRAALVPRVSACCAPTTLRSRAADALRAAGDVCCPSHQERLARTMRVVYGA